MTHERLPRWRAWRLNILLGLDRLGNALFGGDSLETISSRAERAWHADHVWGRWLCRGLNQVDPGHCTHPGRRWMSPAERQAILDRLQRIRGDPDGEDRSPR